MSQLKNNGWIDPDDENSSVPTKRRRVEETTPEKVKIFESNGKDTGNEASPRSLCRYGSSCYRRNETHLIQFRHQLLEDAFCAMEAADDFSKLPEGFNLRDGDERVILEQVEILKDAGFVPERKIPAVNVSSVESPKSSLSNIDSTGPSSSKSVSPSHQAGSSLDPIAKLFQERRERMKLKQEVSQKIKSTLDGTTSVKQDKPLASKSVENTASMEEKWEASCPFNFFLTKVRDVPNEPNGILSASFTDLFDPTFGEIKALCHINYMVETSWLLDQINAAGLEGKQTRIIHGEDNTELEEATKACPWLKIFRAKSPFPYGHHHTKMSIVQYTDDSLRFFVYTANLIESDWDNRTQGIWISPKCPRLPSGSPATDGESPTKFRADIILYLSTYAVQATAAWAHVIKFADCSQIKVFFIGSAPITSKSDLNGFQFGIKKMERILRAYEMDTEPNWPLIAQCSSIGTLGGNASDWLTSEFGSAMAGKDRTLLGPINFVYPSRDNVKGSFDGVLGGGCLPYSAMTHMKQRWLDKYFRQWKADRSGRSRAPPHIKAYSRWSPDYSKMAWFLLTSANLSKAAWGSVSKKGDRLTIMSWEAGVLFVPQLFGESKHFTLSDGPCSGDGSLNFPLHIDIPTVPYVKGDHPWFVETLKLAMSE